MQKSLLHTSRWTETNLSWHLKQRPLAWRSVISAAENFFVSVGLEAGDEATEDALEAARAEDVAGHDLVAERDADLGGGCRRRRR